MYNFSYSYQVLQKKKKVLQKKWPTAIQEWSLDTARDNSTKTRGNTELCGK